MEKANHDLNLYQDFVSDLGVPFVCPNCSELFGSEEYLSQHLDICNGIKHLLSSEVHPEKHPDTYNSNDSLTSKIISFNVKHGSSSPLSEMEKQQTELGNDISLVLPTSLPLHLEATTSCLDVFHSQTLQPLEGSVMHSNDVLLSSTNNAIHLQTAFPLIDELDVPGINQHSSPHGSLVSKYATIGLDPPGESSSVAFIHQQCVNPENMISSTSGIQVCTECGRSFTNKTDLKAHMRIHTGEKPFACMECGQRFAHKSNLTKHNSVHTQDRPFVCPLCSASFALKSGLKLHWRTHTGEKPFECPECGQRFSSNGNFKKHATIHSGEKPFGCKVCGRRYSSSEALQSHSSIHTGEKCFVCLMCDVGFAHRNALQAHIRTHTGEKPFMCDHCDLSFARRGGLKVHMRIHTGEKPYSCSECGQAFSHKSNLNAHYRTHTGEKPFACPCCDQKFGHNSNLKKHILTHGDESNFFSPASNLVNSRSSTNLSSALPSSPTTVTKMTALVGSHFSNNRDPKLFDLLDMDMLEQVSAQALLGT